MIQQKIDEAHSFLYDVVDALNVRGFDVTEIVGLYSGGNDSTILVHLFREHFTHLLHANTGGPGMEETRNFVRSSSQLMCPDVPLLEMTEAEGFYEDYVLNHGFPGHMDHPVMYQMLKEVSFDAARRGFESYRSRTKRTIFLGGKRRAESKNRRNIPWIEEDGGVVWVSPLASWTRLDMNAYRRHAGDVPVNEVSVHLEMSGECLCGCYARKGELEMIEDFFPASLSHRYIRDLERKIAHSDSILPWRKRYGWSAWFKHHTQEELDALPRFPGGVCENCTGVE